MGPVLPVTSAVAVLRLAPIVDRMGEALARRRAQATTEIMLISTPGGHLVQLASLSAPGTATTPPG